MLSSLLLGREHCEREMAVEFGDSDEIVARTNTPVSLIPWLDMAFMQHRPVPSCSTVACPSLRVRLSRLPYATGEGNLQD